jgi:hypothetical protein
MRSPFLRLPMTRKRGFLPSLPMMDVPLMGLSRGAARHPQHGHTVEENQAANDFKTHDPQERGFRDGPALDCGPCNLFVAADDCRRPATAAVSAPQTGRRPGGTAAQQKIQPRESVSNATRRGNELAC